MLLVLIQEPHYYSDRSPRRSLRVWCGSWSFFFHLVFSSEWFCTLCFFSVSSWGRVCRVLRPRAPHLSFFRANVRNNNKKKKVQSTPCRRNLRKQACGTSLSSCVASICKPCTHEGYASTGTRLCHLRSVFH